MESPQVLHEDADLLVVEKPAGLLTIATAKERQKTLYAYLRDRLNRRRPPEKLFIVHRLDREVSGLLVFAKTPRTKEALQDQFRTREAGRTYVALVEGVVAEDAFTIRTRLAETKAFRVYATESAKLGKEAVTHVRVLERRRGRTLVEVTLETGRKHQIRVHLAHKGHPVVGDRRYGTARPGNPRLELRAVKLRFRHPRTGRAMDFTAPPRASGPLEPTLKASRAKPSSAPTRRRAP